MWLKTRIVTVGIKAQAEEFEVEFRYRPKKSVGLEIDLDRWFRNKIDCYKGYVSDFFGD